MVCAIYYRMATKKKKPKSRRRNFGDGYAYEFHGSFTSKAAAEKKARKVGGWMVSRKVFHGASGLRYVVMTQRAGNVPF